MEVNDKCPLLFAKNWVLSAGLLAAYFGDILMGSDAVGYRLLLHTALPIPNSPPLCGRTHALPV